jgi:hypothetical protein
MMSQQHDLVEDVPRGAKATLQAMGCHDAHRRRKNRMLELSGDDQTPGDLMTRDVSEPVDR